MNCPFYKFDACQKKVYFMLLEMIKEINFDAFIDVRRKLFFLNNNNTGDTDRSGSTYKVNFFYYNFRAKRFRIRIDSK